jgi:uncharacterized protein (TIGR00661 family)
MTGNKPKHVLVCPLNWGLGHAARCTPVIHELLKQGFSVTIAADGPPLAFLKTEFPDLPVIEFPGCSPEYAPGKAMVWKMIKSIPGFLKGIWKEHHLLDKLLKTESFDLVISDNRYGLNNRKSESILIIHQLMIKTPRRMIWAEPLLWLVNRFLMRKFDQVWVPDFAGPNNLSGDLSHKYPVSAKVKFIGPLSRFIFIEEEKDSPGKEDILAIVSGPEPQRSIFENILKEQLSAYGHPAALVSGKPTVNMVENCINKLTIYPHLDSYSLYLKIKEAPLIISRPGYSTLMDLSFIGGKALFIPTPGQTEQEYLAWELLKEGVAYSTSQRNMNLEQDIRKAMQYPGISRINKNELLSLAINQFSIGK